MRNQHWTPRARVCPTCTNDNPEGATSCERCGAGTYAPKRVSAPCDQHTHTNSQEDHSHAHDPQVQTDLGLVFPELVHIPRQRTQGLLPARSLQLIG